MEDVFRINLVKISLNSCISLIWPLVSSGTGLTSSEPASPSSLQGNHTTWS